MSWEFAQFQDVLKNGENSKYYPMFLTTSSSSRTALPKKTLAGIYRPRPGLPFTHYNLGGKTRLVWVSFTPQQVDIDTHSAKGSAIPDVHLRSDGRQPRAYIVSTPWATAPRKPAPAAS